MTKLNFFATALVAAASVAASANAAPTVHLVGAGSSAIWQTAAYGAWHDLAGSGAHHWTAKGKTAAGNNFAQLHDSRDANIPNEGGNLWIVWSADLNNIWTDLSVDSVVGNRSFFAQPRATLQVDASAETTAGQQLIAATLWGNDATSVPSTVYGAINNAAVTAAFTDIRPEDAEFAQRRAHCSPVNTTNWSCLGYVTSDPHVGASIKSALSVPPAAATPVDFNISGTDPITGKQVVIGTTISIGASPVVLLINRTNSSGLGKPGVFKNIELANLQSLYNGSVCDSNEFGASGAPANVPVTVLLREPISGTMNTMEFTNLRLAANPNNSQEVNVFPPADNPLNKTCTSGGGKRMRAIGTGEMVNSGVLPIKDSIGYSFFGYGNFSKIAATPSYGYLTLQGIDPIFSSYSNGNLPACTAPCPATGSSTFPHLRDGTYRSWSVLRVVTDSTGLTNTQNLVTAIQNDVDSTVPDFVPYKTTNGSDVGLKLYRSHYTQVGVAPVNPLPGAPGPEAGGDVGGCIEHLPATYPGVTQCHQ